jgi:hypothetical protein
VPAAGHDRVNRRRLAGHDRVNRRRLAGRDRLRHRTMRRIKHGSFKINLVVTI